MPSIDLPRALQDYFAFAETTPTRNGRRFSITLPYVRTDGRLDRMQWWYHLSPAKERALGDFALDTLRTQAVRQFHAHIERWLQNTSQFLYGQGAIPHLAPNSARGSVDLAAAAMKPTPEVVSAVACDEMQAAAGAEETPASVDLPESKTAFG